MVRTFNFAGILKRKSKIAAFRQEVKVENLRKVKQQSEKTFYLGSVNLINWHFPPTVFYFYLSRITRELLDFLQLKSSRFYDLTVRVDKDSAETGSNVLSTCSRLSVPRQPLSHAISVSAAF